MNPTLPSKFLQDLLITVWSEPSGRIFLLSVSYYLFSAFIVSGYMAYFSGGFGNIGFGDYSLIDFLFFLPTLIVTGLNIVYDNFGRAAWNIFLYLIFPNFVGILIAAWVYKIPHLTSILPSFFFTLWALYISFIGWLIGLSMLLSGTRYKWWMPILLQLLGTFFFSVAAVGMATRGVKLPSMGTSSVVLNVFAFIGNVAFLVTAIGGSFLIILLIGMSIARGAIKYKYLSQIIRMELTQSVPGLDKWLVQTANTDDKTFWSLFKSEPIIPMNYHYELKGDALLIASLKKFAAIYIHEADGMFNENGRLFLISNANIQSLELKSGKR